MGKIVLIAVCLTAFIISFTNYTYQKKMLGIMFLFMLVCMGWVSSCPDYEPYYDFFKAMVYFNPNSLDKEDALWFGYSTDYGFSLWTYIFYNFGFSYEEFRFITAFIFLSILFYIIYKLSINVVLVVVIYILNVFPMDIIQLRNFMAEIVLLIAIYEYSKDCKYGVVKFILIDILAASFHLSFLLYIPIIFFVRLREKKYIAKTTKILMIAALAMPLYESFIINGIDLTYFDFLKDTNLSVFQYYMSANAVHYGFLVSYAKVVIIMLMLRYVKTSIGQTDDVGDRFCATAYYLFQAMLILLPIIGINGTLYRFPRNLVIVAILAVAIHLDKNKCQYSYNRMKCIFLLGFILVAVLEYFAQLDSIECILENNFFFNLIEAN